MKYMHLHELLYFFNIHLNLSNKALRRGHRTKQMHVTFPFLFFFTLHVTDSSKRLGHPKKRLIIYRVSKGMCRRQLETAQGFAMFSTSVRKRAKVKKTSRRVRGVLPGSGIPPPYTTWCSLGGGNPPGDTTFTSGKHMLSVSMTPQFWPSSSEFFHGKYILNYFLSLCLLSKQNHVCLFACQARK